MTRPLFNDDEVDYVTQLEERIARIERSIAIDQWHNVGATGEPAFANGWVNFGTDDREMRFYRSGGRCYLEGIIKNGIVGSPAFTLPVGYLPTFEGTNALWFPVMSNGALGGVVVYFDGRVVPAAPATNGWVDLSSINFRCV
jgi:hypothetical protein